MMLIRSQIRQYFNLFRKNNDGATAIEFSIVSALLFTALFAVLELSLMLYATSLMEGGLRYGARLGMTGNDYGAVDRTSLIKSVIKERAAPLVDENQLLIEAKKLSDFNDNTPTPSGFGWGGEVVIYTATYQWTFYTPFIGDLFSSNPNHQYAIRVSTIVQNEEF